MQCGLSFSTRAFASRFVYHFPEIIPCMQNTSPTVSNNRPSLLHSCFGGALCDDTKNGCVADHNRPSFPMNELMNEKIRK